MKKYFPGAKWLIFRNVVWVCIIIVATFAYLELGVRVLTKITFPLLRSDPNVGSIHVSNYFGNVWNEESKKNRIIRTNNIGYIGDDVDLEKASNTIRIAIIGDSVVEAVQVDYFNNFTSLLESTLNVANTCKGMNFEVLNFGVQGMGTFLEYQTFKKNISPLQPDYVFLFFNEDYPNDILKLGVDPENFSEKKSFGIKSFLWKFELTKFVFNKLQKDPEFISTLQKLGILKKATIPDGLDVTNNSSTTPETEESYQWTFDLISRLNSKVSEQNSTLTVFVYPKEKDYETKDGWKTDQNIVRLIEYLDHAEIQYINPSSDLEKAHAGAEVCLTYGCHTHLTEKGHQVIASILYKNLNEKILPKLGCAVK